MRATVPVSRHELVTLVAVAALVGAVQSASVVSWRPMDLGMVVASLREGTPIWSIPLALLAVWLLRSHGRRSVVIGSQAALSTADLTRPVLAPLVCLTTLGCAVGWLPSIVAGARNGATALEILAATVLLISVAALATVAAAIAALFPATTGVIVVPLAVLISTLLPATINQTILTNTGYSTIGLAWFWGMAEPVNGLDFVWHTEILRAIFFILLGLTAWLTTAHWVSFRTTRRVTPLLTGALLLLAPFAVFVTTTLASPNIVRPDGARLECHHSKYATICLPPIELSLAADVAHTADRILGQLPAAARPLDVVISHDEAETGQHLIIGYPTAATRREWLETVASTIASQLAGSNRCQVPQGELTEDQASRSQLMNAVAEALYVRAGYPPTPRSAINEQTGEPATAPNDAPADRLHAALVQLPRAAFDQWIRNHHEAIRTCQLNPDMTPK